MVFTISYAPGLDADEHTLLALTLNLRTLGHNNNASFRTNADVEQNPFGIPHLFDNSLVSQGILTVNFEPS